MGSHIVVEWNYSITPKPPHAFVCIKITIMKSTALFTIVITNGKLMT